MIPKSCKRLVEVDFPIAVGVAGPVRRTLSGGVQAVPRVQLRHERGHRAWLATSGALVGAAHGEEPPPVVAHGHPVGLCHASLPPYSCGGAIGQRAPSLPIHGMAAHRADGGDCVRTRKPLGSVCRASSVTNGARLGSERWGAPLPRGHGQRPRCAGGLDVVESRPAQ